VACFETPLWNRFGSLLIRAENDGSDVLLMRVLTPDERLKVDYEDADFIVRCPRDDVYRYDPGARTLQATRAQDWNAATGVICDCGLPNCGQRRQAASRPAVMAGWDFNEHVFRYGSRILETAGPVVVASVVDPTGEFAAAVSADGPIIDTRVGFLGNFGSKGQHYHQIVRRRDGTFVGEALRLPLVSYPDALDACWSPDGRYVIYRDVYFTRLCIVRVDLGEETRR